MKISFLKGLLGILPLVFLCLGLQAAPAQAEYKLQPGDTVRLEVAGLPQLSLDAFVDGEGLLDLAWIGRVDASGRTVQEVETEVRLTANGQILRQYNGDGQVFTISLEGNRLDVRLSAYRPIVISGDVLANGQVPFSPGLTVREAVALSGGPKSLAVELAENIDPIRVIDWQNALGDSVVARADARMRIWRINADLLEDWTSTPPDFSSNAFSVAINASMVAEQAEVLRAGNRKVELEQSHFEESDQQAGRRIEILKEQQTQQLQALEFDREEELRTRDLVERGLTPGTRLTEVRRTVVASATQLLDIEEALTAAELFRLRLSRDFEDDKHVRILDLLKQKRLAEADLRKADSQLNVLAQFLGAAGVTVQDTTIPKADYEATVFRKTADGIVMLASSKDTLLEPGDLVEIETVLPPAEPNF